MKTTLTIKSIWTFLLLFVGLALFAQDPAQYGTPFAGVPDPRDVSIYQVNVRQYSTTHNLQGVINGLDNMKALGINVVYLMPIYPFTTDPTKGADGSPYSIKDLKGVAADLGTLADLRALTDAAHTKGMAVMLDWVANQTAWDHPWITAHKDWYKQDASGNILSPTPDGSFFFSDCAALNFSNTSMRAAMVDAMRYWVFAANVDGFRCDWADNPPQDFWTNTIANLRGITSHKLLMLAEGSNEGTSTGCTTCGPNQPGAHYAEGFDFIFGESYYWNFMKKIYKAGGDPATGLDGITTGEYIGANANQLVARYMSNHDEYGSDGSPYKWLGESPGNATVCRNSVLSAFVIASYYRGVPFIYDGIEVGNTNALTYPWRDPAQTINWTQDPTVLAEMKKLMNFRNASTSLRRGTPTSYTTTNVVAFTKISGTEKTIIMANTRNSASTFVIPAAMAGTYNDAFTNASVTLTSGATQSLSALQYIVLTNVNVPVVAVTGVSVTPTSASVKAGLTTQLNASVAPSNATNQSVTWSSSNTGIATVDANGLVKGVTAGTATITVKTADGAKTATCAVTVSAATTFTVHFYKPAAWTGPSIYWWTALPAGILADGTWPGVAMTNEGTGWYSYTFTNINSTNIIFNDGTTAGNKSVDLSRAGTNGWYLGTTWYNSQPNLVAVTGVTMSPTSATVAVGATSQLTGTVAPSNANNLTVTWTSSNTAVATVNATGLVTAVAAGSATITVTTQDGGKTATCAITVPAPTQSAYSGTIAIPGTIEVENFDNGGENVAYHDNDAANNGGQYRTNYGVDIEVCGEGGYNVGWTNAGEWLEYTVNIASAGTYNIDVRAASGDAGGTFRIEFGGVDKTGTLTVPGTGGYQSWQTVSKTGVSLSAGTQIMRIYMISGGYNLNKVTLTSVSSVAVTSVSLSPTSTTLTIGGTQQLTPTVLPSNATNKAVTYSSSNTAIATVNASGLISAIAAGTATITVTTQDGAKTATCAVIVSTATGTYYTIMNRWKGTYLYDAGANVGYGATVANNNYKWQKVAIDATYFWLKNVGTGEYMHIENQTGSVQCTSVTLDWWSAQWSSDYIDGTWTRVRNKWQTGSIIHVENQTGSAQYAGAQDAWYSAQWQFQVTTLSAKVETSVDNSEISTNVRIFPNPMMNKLLNIEIDGVFNNSESVITCTDLSGKTLSKNKLQGSGSINLDLNAGVYLLTIQNGESKVTKKLFVK